MKDEKTNVSKETQQTTEVRKKRDMNRIIGNTLRYGVTIACVIALAGGALYLIQNGNEPVKDYSIFDPNHPAYTNLRGIFSGFFNFQAWGVIQVAVIGLLLTPIMRVVLSLLDFVQERDWLYAAVTSLVLAIIFVNSITSPV